MRIPVRRSLRVAVVLLALGVPSLAAQAPELAVERQLAEELGLLVGDTLLLGPTADSATRPAIVGAIYEPRPDPAEIAKRERHVRLHLPDLAATLDEPDRVDRFGVALRTAIAPDSAAIAM